MDGIGLLYATGITDEVARWQQAELTGPETGKPQTKNPGACETTMHSLVSSSQVRVARCSAMSLLCIHCMPSVLGVSLLGAIPYPTEKKKLTPLTPWI